MSLWGSLAGIGLTGAGVATLNPALALGGAGVLVGDQNAEFKRKQQQDNMLANAEAIRYSPWTGMKPGMMKADVDSPFMNMMQGGLTGAMMGSQFGKVAPVAPGVTPAVAAAATPDSALEAGGGFAPGSFAEERARLASPTIVTPDVGDAPYVGGQLPAKNVGNPMPGQSRWAGLRPTMLAQNAPNFYQTGSPWGQMSSNYGMG